MGGWDTSVSPPQNKNCFVMFASEPVGGRSWTTELPCCFVLNLFTHDPNLYLI